MASETEKAWQRLFADLNLAEQIKKRGFARVQADEIKSSTGREPRLMTKFDTRESRPEILKRAHLTVLPISNGTYVLARGDGYEDLTEGPEPVRVPSRALDHLQTLETFCTSEAQVLEVAHTCGLIQRFTGEPVKRTTSGRMRGGFNFRFVGDRDLDFEVDGVQVEVDGCFEGDRVYLFEAKMGARDNFLVRQLYFPARIWQQRGVTKPITPVFVTYSNFVFSFHEFSFDDVNIYTSIRLVRTASYVLDDNRAAMGSRSWPGASAMPAREPMHAPFPQADDLRKVVDVVDAVAVGRNAKAELTSLYGFAPRQASYYGDAARYLGFLELAAGTSAYKLTDRGREFVQLRRRGRDQALAQALLASPVIRAAAATMSQSGSVPDKDLLAEGIGRARPELTGTTLLRRAQTLSRWLMWLGQNRGPVPTPLRSSAPPGA